MTHRLARTGTAAVFALASAVTACGGDGGEAPSSDAAESEAGEPRFGGSLVYTVNADVGPRGFDPVAMSIQSADEHSGPQGYPLYDTLLLPNPDTGEVEMGIAESFESDDGLTWQLRIRPDVRFSDGTPFDAEAVKFNWERHADPAESSLGGGVAREIESMTVVDPLTLQITLQRTNTQFPRSVARRLALVASPTAIRAAGEDYGSRPVGAGPFVLAEWVRDDHARFVRNPDYWRAPLPYVDEFVVRVIPDRNQRYNSLVAGESDLMLISDPVLQSRAAAEGFQVADWVSNSGRTIMFNLTRPPFDDVRVRRAVQLAIDVDDLSAVLGDGQIAVARSIFNEQSEFYDDRYRFPGPDRDEAQRLIDEYVEETGEPLSFTLSGGSASRPDAEYFQAQLGQLDDVEVEILLEDNARSIERSVEKNYDAHLSGFVFVDPEPILYDTLHTDGGVNLSGYSDPEMNEALEAAISSFDPDVRAESYETVQRLFLRDVPHVLYQHIQTATVAQPSVREIVTFFDGIPRVESMWIDE